MDDFEKIRSNDFYYVDKTGLIRELLRNWCEVTLFTRPRRFGKSLNMSMLEAYLSPDTNKQIFEGLAICREKSLCEKYMGKCPVISISMKGIDADHFEMAYELAVRVINEAAYKVYPMLKESPRLLPEEKGLLSRLLSVDLKETEFIVSLRTLSRLMEKHYGCRVVILIDEYDVPLEKANECGYYDRMLLLIRGLYQQTLKSNSSMYFAVLTGCMRISKESIFTGLNNLRVLGITDARLDEYFGFTDEEVRAMLAYYDASDKYNLVQEWYDGYRFGEVNVYCPWDVINYCDALDVNPKALPQSYWINSSGNGIVRRFICQSKYSSVKRDLEKLVSGEAVEKVYKPELTYQNMYDSIEHIWSVLFMTGYLTQREAMGENRYRFVLPNLEVKYVFQEQIMELFLENVKNDGETLRCLCDAFLDGDAAAVEKFFGSYLGKTISNRDTYVQNSMKENFYHGILLGILGVKEGWNIASNREAGDGYRDILVEVEDPETAILIEVKYAQDGNLKMACKKAMEQIEEKHYADELYEDGYARVIKFGIACYKKKCCVMVNKT